MFNWQWQGVAASYRHFAERCGASPNPSMTKTRGPQKNEAIPNKIP